MDSLVSSIKIAGSGMAAQTRRIQVVAENIANANSTATVAGGNPYQRKIISFIEELDRKTGVNLVKTSEVARDNSPFRAEFDPASPYADESGFVKLPNVNAIIEMADMREANRSYEANLQVIKQVRDLISMSVDLLRAT